MTGLVAGARVRPEIGWDTRRPAQDGTDGGPGVDTPIDAGVEADVRLVLAFLNTLNIEDGTDVLTDPARWRRWHVDQRFGVPDGVPDTGAARAVRAALRSAVTNGHDPGAPPPDDPPATYLPTLALGGALSVRLHEGVPVLVAGDAIGAVLAAGARLAVLGQWDRVKICPAADCQFAFFDHSRNRSRTWCSMRVCGNRTKARNWRERARSNQLS